MREADNLTTFICRMSWKSGSLNLLELSGPRRACYGIPFYIPECIQSSHQLMSDFLRVLRLVQLTVLIIAYGFGNTQYRHAIHKTIILPAGLCGRVTWLVI